MKKYGLVKYDAAFAQNRKNPHPAVNVSPRCFHIRSPLTTSAIG